MDKIIRKVKQTRQDKFFSETKNMEHNDPTRERERNEKRIWKNLIGYVDNNRDKEK